MSEYSDAEIRLITAISPSTAALLLEGVYTAAPPRVYSTLAEIAFINDMRGPEVDALRRVRKALSTCEVYRGTPEFDELCRF